MLHIIFRALLSIFKARESLILENAALRHQISILQRHSTRPQLKWRDRAFWDVLSCFWPNWRRSLYIVQPETVVSWHRRGFRYYWRSSRSTSSLCRQPLSGCSTSSWFSTTPGGRSSTSTSPPTRQRHGQASKSPRPSLGTRPPSISSEIETGSTAPTSLAE